MHLLHHRTYLIFPLVSLALLAATFALARLAHAEDAVWSYVIPATLHSQHVPPWNDVPNYFSLSNINVQVSYHANATNLATGASICSGTVAVGDRVRFAPQPYAYTDIYWFGSGGANDSPYGDWLLQAGQPPLENMCADKNLVYIQPIWRAGYGPRDHYVDLSVNPPDARTVTVPQNLFSCGSPASDGSVTCTATTAGSGLATFNFGSTYGILYKTYQDPYYAPAHPYTEQCTWDDPLYTLPDGNTYTLSVPAQSISCPITVIAASGNPPTPPQLTSGGSCIVGAAQNISMTSTDPDSDTLRYGIDWDADGSVDQFVPPSGYVPSGTTQTVSRTYSIAGTKTLKVMAQDSNGLTSGWASVSFSCADTASSAGQCTDNIDNDGDGLIDSKDPDCAASGGTSEFTAVPPPTTPPPGIPSADLRLSVPSLIGRGKSVQVVWSADNVSSCLPVTGTNGDSFAQLSFGTSFFSPIGGRTSAPITARTTYALSCSDLNGVTRFKTGTVNIQPSFRER
ncbi:hypothetical protein HY413_02910 [Candidatus Kaiserbacteria bacterium]|nr:hypothetical protein [Candidatus Kaiserbacteria bacterium]